MTLDPAWEHKKCKNVLLKGLLNTQGDQNWNTPIYTHIKHITRGAVVRGTVVKVLL